MATDIVHQHSQRLDYYKGNFTQFYATKSDRQKNLRKEYETQLVYRQHLQVSRPRLQNSSTHADSHLLLGIYRQMEVQRQPSSASAVKDQDPRKVT